jgi:hypothetical protein
MTRTGKHEPFELQVARGQIAFHKTIFKFGFNPDIDNSLETIWTEGGLYSYLSSASILKVSSSSTADDEGSTGAETVQIYGLDADYNEINEVIILDGQTAVDSTKEYLRINRMIVRSAGSGGTNAGIIYVGTGTVTSGVPTNKYATINVGDGQSLMALWTVPAGYTAYVTQTDITVATTQNNKYATIHFVARPFGEVFQVKDKFVKSESSNHQGYTFPLKFEEKTDLEFRAIGDSVGADIAISAGIDIVYIKNEIPPQ